MYTVTERKLHIECYVSFLVVVLEDKLHILFIRIDSKWLMSKCLLFLIGAFVWLPCDTNYIHVPCNHRLLDVMVICTGLGERYNI